MEKEINQSEINSIFSNEEIAEMYAKMHTPWERIEKVGRNEICPFCDSGKKFKNCDCYKEHKQDYKFKGQ